MDSPDTLVATTTTSLATPPPNCRQLSTPDAVALSTVIEELSSESYETILILLALLQGITENTTSGDVLALGAYRAKDLCEKFGVSEEAFRRVLAQYARFAQSARAWNPFAF